MTAQSGAVRIAWPANRDESQAIANAFGYISASIALAEAFERNGGIIDDDAEWELHFVNPMGLRPREGRKTVLFTMYEHAEIPPYFSHGFGRADLVLVPSRYCRSIFTPLARAHDVPMDMVPLGFEPSRFPFHPRSWRPGEPFYFLHVGAPNGRKGIVPVAHAWDAAFRDHPDARLIVKTTTDQTPTVERHGNIVFDSRRYSAEEMTELYHRAHCLVWPSCGEGFGLPALEAMATGLPIITVKHSAHPEFLERDAFYVPHWMKESPDIFGWKIRGAAADPEDLARAMRRVMGGYQIALAKAARGALRAHKSWTWDHAARRLIEVLVRRGVGTQRGDDSQGRVTDSGSRQACG